MSEQKIKCKRCGTENDINDNFCGSCGAFLISKIENNMFFKAIMALFRLINFLICACILSAIFVAPLIFYIYAMWGSPEGENVFQQIYNYIGFSSGILGVGIGVVAGLVLTFAFQTVTKLNHIEDKIEEIQRNINKEG